MSEQNNNSSAMNPALVPSSFAQVRAIQAEIMDRWHELEPKIGDWDSALNIMEARQETGWAATCERLQLINTFQWHEEDKSRAHGTGDEFLGAVKRSIDASNRRRVQTVDQLDDIIFNGLSESGQLNENAPLNSESPGSIIDRLSVLMLKLYHVTEARDKQSAAGNDTAPMQERVDTLSEQINDLGGCLDSLLKGISQGTVRVKFYRQVKVYIDPATGEIKSDL
ncbi:MAG: DUF4254 domain-containing protein [bacterium]|nr:DUF4254 domain-containing protein [bacterium]